MLAFPSFLMVNLLPSANISSAATKNVQFFVFSNNFIFHFPFLIFYWFVFFTCAYFFAFSPFV